MLGDDGLVGDGLEDARADVIKAMLLATRLAGTAAGAAQGVSAAAPSDDAGAGEVAAAAGRTSTRELLKCDVAADNAVVPGVWLATYGREKVALASATALNELHNARAFVARPRV